MRLSSGTASSLYDEFGDSFAGKRVLVTGATGFIGSHLCDALSELGAKVYCLSRRASSETVTNGCTPVPADLTNLSAVTSVLTTVQPHIVYHLGALVNTQRALELVVPTIQANLIGVVNTLLASRQVNCDRIIMVGSIEELTATEDSAQTSPYAVSKAAAHLYAKMLKHLCGLPITWARLFVTYGPGQMSNKLIPYAISCIVEQREPSLLTERRLCDFVYIDDVVRGLLAAGIRQNIDGVTLDLGTGILHSIQSVVNTITEIINVTPSTPKDSCLEATVKSVDLKDTHKLLNWAPQWSLGDGLIATVAWYRKAMEVNRW